MGPLLKGAGDLVTADANKAEVLNTFSTFSSLTMSHRPSCLGAGFKKERNCQKWKKIKSGIS